MKILKYAGLFLILATVVMVVLANRDMTRIYGGLTERVDVTRFTPKDGPLAIRNVNVLSSDGERFIPGQTVLVENGLIVSVGPSASAPEARHSVDGEGKYLIPGLTDSHVHLFKSPNDLLLYVANGVTSIREMIGEPDHLAWRRKIEGGQIGPEMFIASPRIGSFEPLEGFFMSWSQGYLNLTDAVEAANAVQELHEQGYDAVKIYSQINKETYEAVTRTARELGMKVVGHVPWDMELSDIHRRQDEVAHLEELMNALNREFGGYGAATAEEFLEFVESRSDAVAKNMAKHNFAVTTTLWLVESFVRQKFELDDVLTQVELAYENPGISEWTPRVPEGGLGWLPGVNRYYVSGEQTEAQKAARRVYWETYAEACRIILTSLIANNVNVVAGTDANLPPTVPGFSLHDELISLNNAGMSASEVLLSATARPADWLDNNAGRILPGRKANLVLLEKDPLADVSNTKSINSVVVNGRLLDRNMLDDILAAVRDANDSSRKADIDRYLN